MSSIFSGIQHLWVSIVSAVTTAILVISPFNKSPIPTPTPTSIQEEVKEDSTSLTPETEVIKSNPTSTQILTPYPTPTPIEPSNEPTTIRDNIKQTSTPTPATTSNPTPIINDTIIYKIDPDYPILTKMEGLDGVFYNSHGNGISGPYFLDRVYHPGDKLYIKAYAQDPKNRQINYKIELNNGGGTFYSNEAEIEIKQDYISDNVGLTVSITVDTPYHRFSDLDDSMQFAFKVRP